MQTAAKERQALLDKAHRQEQLLLQQVKEKEQALKEAEASMQVAIAARDAAHGNDLHLLEGGLLQRVEVETCPGRPSNATCTSIMPCCYVTKCCTAVTLICICKAPGGLQNIYLLIWV